MFFHLNCFDDLCVCDDEDDTQQQTYRFWWKDNKQLFNVVDRIKSCRLCVHHFTNDRDKYEGGSVQMPIEIYMGWKLARYGIETTQMNGEYETDNLLLTFKNRNHIWAKFNTPTEQ